MTSYRRPGSNFNMINDELARSRYAEQLYNERLAAEEAASLARGEVFIDIPLAEEEAMPLIRQAPRVARQAPRIAGQSIFQPIMRVVRPLARTAVGRVVGRVVGGALSAEAGFAYGVGEGIYTALTHYDDEQKYQKRLNKMKAEGYKELSSEGVKEVQPRGDESLSKYTEYKPMEKLKQKIEEINPTPVKTQNPAMTITPKKITTKTSTPPPKIYVTPEPDEPDQPREPPQIIAQPASQAPPTASPTMSPPLPPPTMTPPPTTQSTTTQQTLTSQLNRDRGLYMGSKPVRPIHGYRVPNNRPYNLVGWERGARAKALLIVQ